MNFWLYDVKWLSNAKQDERWGLPLSPTTSIDGADGPVGWIGYSERPSSQVEFFLVLYLFRVSETISVYFQAGAGEVRPVAKPLPACPSILGRLICRSKEGWCDGPCISGRVGLVVVDLCILFFSSIIFACTLPCIGGFYFFFRASVPIGFVPVDGREKRG